MLSLMSQARFCPSFLLAGLNVLPKLLRSVSVFWPLVMAPTGSCYGRRVGSQ